MRTSKYLLFTLKEAPSYAEVISHKLMLRAGIVRQLASGLYNWLPTGIRVLRKVENIVREEMNSMGAIEISMPIVQPAYLWQKSGRLEQYGAELLRFFDLNSNSDSGSADSSFIIGPTNEEVITNLIRNEVNSYKQLPLQIYQIQTKFRNEIRPRFGVIRSREFIMKDAYSFHLDQDSLQKTYNAMYATYDTIFTRIGLKFIAVQADNGYIGGNVSHEFHVLADIGEDKIVFSKVSDYAANIELAEASCVNKRAAPTENLRLVETPNIKNIAELVKLYTLPIEKTVKTLIVKAIKDSGHKFVALVIRGDHELNITKAEKHPLVERPLNFATEAEIRALLKTSSGSLGPLNLLIPVIIDRSVAVMSDFIAGANIDYQYYFGINWQRDIKLPEVYDLRNVVVGDFDPSPSLDSPGVLHIKQGIEVGHIFQIGTKYSEAMKANIHNKYGKNQKFMMGCYGIGLSRVIAATIEQNNDDRGIIWPDAIAPFQVVILPINMHKSYKVKQVSEQIYLELQEHGIDVIYDDRKERPGIMFADMELIGIPHILVVGDRNLEQNKIEYRYRRSLATKQFINPIDIVDFLKVQIKQKHNTN